MKLSTRMKNFNLNLLINLLLKFNYKSLISWVILNKFLKIWHTFYSFKTSHIKKSHVIKFYKRRVKHREI